MLQHLSTSMLVLKTKLSLFLYGILDLFGTCILELLKVNHE